MFSKTVAFGVLAAGCMAAAAGGAYVAMRHNAPLQEHAAVTAPPLAGETAAPVAEPAAPIAPGFTNPEPVTPVVVPRPPATRQAARQPARTRTAERPRPTPTATLPAEPSAQPIEEYTPVWTPVAPVSAAEERVEYADRHDAMTVPADTVIGVQVDTAVSSETARVEDRVEGRVTRDVTVDGRVAIPAGARLIGAVSQVDRGGKFRERARIAVSFHTVQLRDGSRVPLRTTAILREGDPPSRESAAKVGGSAVGGAVLGAILGGAKGAVIGGSAGAAGGAAVVVAGDRNPAVLPEGTTVTVRLMESVSLR
jgi:hypothetical protein